MKGKKAIVISIILAAAIVLCSAVAITAWIGPKKIQVGIMSSSPLAYQSEEGEWSGYDIDFATRLFTQLGYKVEFIQVDAVSREKMLRDGEIDCYMSGTYSGDADFLYSDYYIESKQVMFYRYIQIGENAELQGMRVGVLSNSENEQSVLEYTERKNVSSYKNNDEMTKELEMGNIDIAITDYMYAEELVKNDERFKEYTVGIIYDVSEHTITMSQKNTKLQKEINEKIAQYKNENYFSTLKSAYFMEKYYY